MDGWLERACRRKCKHQAWAYGLATALAAWPTVAIVAAYFDDLTGPHPIESAELRRWTAGSSIVGRFVEVECRDASPADVEWSASDSSRQSDWEPCWIVRSDDALIAVAAPSPPTDRVRGVVVYPPRGAVFYLTAAQAKQFASIALRVRDPRVEALIAIGIFAGVTAGLGALFVRSIRRALDPVRHPALAAVAARMDLATASAEVTFEMQLDDVHRYYGWTLTRHWLVDERFLRFDVRRWRGLVWVYGRSVRHYHELIIPGETTHHIHLHFDSGAEARLDRGGFAFRRANVRFESTLRIIAERAPWAIQGFDPQVLRAWNRDRARLVAEVRKRRDAIEDASRRPSP